jgi:hypothetical protein
VRLDYEGIIDNYVDEATNTTHVGKVPMSEPKQDELVAACREWLGWLDHHLAYSDERDAQELAAFVRDRIAQARLEAFEQFRRELVGGTLPHEEKDLTMQIKQILIWADSRIAELRKLAEHVREGQGNV